MRAAISLPLGKKAWVWWVVEFSKSNLLTLKQAVSQAVLSIPESSAITYCEVEKTSAKTNRPINLSLLRSFRSETLHPPLANELALTGQVHSLKGAFMARIAPSFDRELIDNRSSDRSLLKKNKLKNQGSHPANIPKSYKL